MTPQEIQEELLVLQTSLFDEELEWVEEEQRLLWQVRDLLHIFLVSSTNLLTPFSQL